MSQKKQQKYKAIVLDADVILHFSKGSSVMQLCTIFKEHEKWILGEVEKEVLFAAAKDVDRCCDMKVLHRKIFPKDNSPMFQEMLRLRKELKGFGESACLAYVRYNDKILASSNLKDIRSYCVQYDIVYLTTMDFLCKALHEDQMTEAECDAFIQTVKAKGSKLPCNSMKEFACDANKIELYWIELQNVV